MYWASFQAKGEKSRTKSLISGNPWQGLKETDKQANEKGQ